MLEDPVVSSSVRTYDSAEQRATRRGWRGFPRRLPLRLWLWLALAGGVFIASASGGGQNASSSTPQPMHPAHISAAGGVTMPQAACAGHQGTATTMIEEFLVQTSPPEPLSQLAVASPTLLSARYRTDTKTQFCDATLYAGIKTDTCASLQSFVALAQWPANLIQPRSAATIVCLPAKVTAATGGGFPFGLDPASTLNNLLTSGLQSFFNDVKTQFIDWASSFGFLYITPAALTYKLLTIQNASRWVIGALDGAVALLLVVGGYNVIMRHQLDLPASGLLDVLPRLALVTLAKGEVGSDVAPLLGATLLGLVQMTLEEQSTPAELARHWHADERGLLRLLPRLHQVLLLQDMVNSLVISSAQALAHPGGVPAAISWHWRREYQQRFVSHHRTWQCRADGALVLQRLPLPPLQERTEGCYSLLLVVEGLIELDHRLIRQQLDGLVRYRESRERIPFYQSFPPLLVVVHQQHQRALWQRCAVEVAMARRVKPLIGAVASVPIPLPATSAWSFPWQHLAAGGPCRLQDLLQPQPAEALLAGIMPPFVSTGRATGASKAPLVRGRLTQRAAHLSMQHDPYPSSEREAIALLSLRLTPRHLRVLRLLSIYPLLAAEEVTWVAQMRAETIGRYLSDLRRFGCLTNCSTERGPRLLLGERGIRLLAALHQVRVQRLTEADAGGRVPRGALLLKRQLHHTAGIYAFLSALYREAALHSVHQVLWCETGARSERSYRFRGVWRHFRPNAAFAYQAGQRRLVAWLEWDEGSMTMRNLAAKLYEYQRFVRGREWVRYETRIVPLLLFVVPDRGQERRVAHVARSILAREGLLVRPRLAAYGPLAAIWLPVVPPGADETKRVTPLV